MVAPTSQGEEGNMLIEVRDDSGALQNGLVEIPSPDVDDFVDQLPEGWYIEVLKEDDR